MSTRHLHKRIKNAIQPLSLAAWFSLGAACSSVHADVAIEEQVVAPISQAARYFVTPNDAHLIAIVPSANRFVVKYDGAEGPVVDEVLNLGGLKYSEFDRGIMGVADSPQKYFAFSDDGHHYAYAARSGDEILIFVDGKEIAKHPMNVATIRGLNFIPSRDVVYYNIKNNRGGRFDFQVVIDGQAGPTVASEPQVRFSRDGMRHAYVALRAEDSTKRYLVIDGKESSYAGESPLFTGNGKKLATLLAADGQVAVQVDGTSLISSANVVQVFVAPVGDRIAVIAHQPERKANVLYVDGVEVAGTQGVDDVKFSPDGKRYAASCRTPAAQRFYVLDGQPQKTYLGMTDAQFSVDSSRFVYVGIDATSRNAVVINDMESDAYASLAMKPTFSAGGKRLAWIAVPQPGQNVLVVDDAQFEPMKSLMRFAFSPDGSRYAFLDNLPTIGTSRVTIDAAPQSDVIYSGSLTPAGFADPNVASPVLFSNDGKHTAYCGALANNPNVQGMIVDGQFMKVTAPPVTRGTFTPDGQHLFWVTWAPPKYTVYLDGKAVAGWESNSVVHNSIDRATDNWKVGADGVLTYLAAAGDVIKRVRITPDVATNLETMLTQSKADESRAQADAEAAAAAAAQKIASEQAAREQAAADAKKAREDAIAAKRKARDDAIAAKKKAQEEAAKAKKKDG